MTTIRLRNANGIEVCIMTYGAGIAWLRTPDRHGDVANIILGFEDVDTYRKGVPYYGATVGRFANRIARGQFALDGRRYQLARNNGPNSLHGGVQGFDKREWSIDTEASSPERVRLTYTSIDGEEGYPGTLATQVTYTLDDHDHLTIDYAATTTAPTPVNLTNHTYFNLSGDFTSSILDHELLIEADSFTPIDAHLIPTGEVRSVTGTPFDFRTLTSIGSRIDAPDLQLVLAGGYDHNWIVEKPPKPNECALAAVLRHPSSGRCVEVRTTQPGLQFYSGNMMDGGPAGEGSVYAYRTGLCLETQHFPDAPNHPHFVNTILTPDSRYEERTVLHFATSS